MVVMKQSILFFAILMTCTGCGPRGQRMSTLRQFQSHKASEMIERRSLASMTFSKWGDVILADVGVARSDGGACRFVPPIKEDESTRWSPFQIYWAIFDNLADVRNGLAISGFYGISDQLCAAQLTRPDGARAIGFSYISDDGARFVNLTPGELLDDGSQLRTVLNITGWKAAIRAFTSDSDGRCLIRSEGCVGDAACFEGGVFVPFGNIAVTQTQLGFPRQVTLEPTLAVTRIP